MAIAEVGLENKFAYALEIERTNQEHSILVLAREDSQRIAADKLQANAYVRFEARLGARRATTGISTKDHNPPGLGDDFRVGITNLAEDCEGAR